MSKRVVAVVVCTLLALAATLLVTPRETVTTEWVMKGPNLDSPDWETTSETAPGVSYDWPWEPKVIGLLPSNVWYGGEICREIAWRYVVLEQALILLLGGGLLTFVARRERRRRALPVTGGKS